MDSNRLGYGMERFDISPDPDWKYPNPSGSDMSTRRSILQHIVFPVWKRDSDSERFRLGFDEKYSARFGLYDSNLDSDSEKSILEYSRIVNYSVSFIRNTHTHHKLFLSLVRRQKLK